MVFSKLNILHLLKELYGQVELPASVYRETVESGIRRGFEDAHVLRLFLSQQRWKPVKRSICHLRFRIPNWMKAKKTRLHSLQKKAHYF